jgi:type II secretory pathway pseudopilin PulG
MGIGEHAVRVRQSGFTYLGALLLIALMGAGLAAIGVIWHTAQQREKERDLLFAGHQFRTAIEEYYQKTPGVGKRYPRSLEALLQDDRFLVPMRHLRHIYFDPMTGKKAWGTVPANDGGIMGVYSLSDEKPVKTGSFADADADFEGRATYADWKFIYRPSSPLMTTGGSATHDVRN